MYVARRRGDGGRDVGVAPIALVFVSGIYGGYFGAAQGVILLAVLAVFVPDDLRRSNALKNVLAGTVNGVAALLFIAVADVAWEAVGLIAGAPWWVGSSVPGSAGGSRPSSCGSSSSWSAPAWRSG